MVAFVDVTVIPMDRERLIPGQTVLVQGGRIVAIGPSEPGQGSSRQQEGGRAGQVPDAGPGRDARAHPGRRAAGQRGRAHSVPLCVRRDHHHPRDAGSSAPPGSSRSRGQRRAAQSHDLYLRAVAQREQRSDAGGRSPAGHRAEGGRIRLPQDPSRASAGEVVRHPGGHRATGRHPVCRSRSPGGRARAGAGGRLRHASITSTATSKRWCAKGRRCLPPSRNSSGSTWASTSTNRGCRRWSRRPGTRRCGTFPLRF